MNQNRLGVSAQEHLQEAVASASYVLHALKDKPMMVAMSAILSQVLAKLTEGLPGHLISIGALSILVFLDWYTKLRACRAMGVPFTSRHMREKGVVKLRDYLVLYMAGAMTVPLMGDVWGYRSVLYALSIWELWSIAENLYDAGTIPFDIRKIALFDGLRELMQNGRLPVPSTPPTTPPPAVTPVVPTDPANTLADSGNLPV